MACT